MCLQCCTVEAMRDFLATKIDNSLVLISAFSSRLLLSLLPQNSTLPHLRQPLQHTPLSRSANLLQSHRSHRPERVLMRPSPPTRPSHYLCRTLQHTPLSRSANLLQSHRSHRPERVLMRPSPPTRPSHCLCRTLQHTPLSRSANLLVT